MARRYPLEALRSLWRWRVQEQTRDLGQRMARAGAAERAAQAARRARAWVQDESGRLDAAERTRLGQGLQSAQDLQRRSLFRRRISARTAELVAAESSAESQSRQAQRDVDQAREALCRAADQVRMVDANHTRWERSGARDRERVEQAEVDDRWVGQARGGPRGSR